jgi:hypothetical protein
MHYAPGLPQDALDLLAVGRRYYDVLVEWVPPGDPSAWGRTFGFWRVQAGPPGWPAAHASRERLVSPVPACPGKAVPPVTCEWTKPRETIKSALSLARRNWPECCERL